MNEEKEEALRFNEGKNMLDLVPPIVVEELGKVLTFGAKKYGRFNYRKGMKWSKCIASLKRHLIAFEKGIDFDDESGLLHLSHILVNSMFLLEYTNLHPELDDRDLWYKRPLKRVFLDIDGVLAGFGEHFVKYLDLPEGEIHDWNDYRFSDNFEKVRKDHDFWLSIPRLIDPKDISYPIAGYCTAREVDNRITEKWLANNGFPNAPIYRTHPGGNKIEILKNNLCDIMVEDSITNFIELNSNNILCYLVSRPHNMKYDVGNLRVKDAIEVLQKIKQ